MQFMLLCKPQKSGALRAFIPFLEVTQKIPSESDRRDSKLSKNIQCEKNSHSLFFNFPKNLQKYWRKNYIPGTLWAFKSRLQIILAANYIALFLPNSNNWFFMCIIPCIHICSYCFLILCFYFHLSFTFSFLIFSPRNTFYNSQCFI